VPSSVSKSDLRCACGRPAITTVCCLLCPAGHSRFCDEVIAKGACSHGLPRDGSCSECATAYRPGAVTDGEPIKCATFSSAEIPADVRAKMDADRASAERKADHVVYDYQTGKLCCGNCGAEEALVLPMSVTLVAERSDAFLEAHEGCPCR
jgi:hypothetical protein